MEKLFDVTPLMTSSTTNSVTVTDNDHQSGWEGWMLFDGNLTTGYASNSGYSGKNVTIQFPYKQRIDRFTIIGTGSSPSGYLPKVFDFQGSNDGTLYTTLLSVSTVSWDSISKDFDVPNTPEYKYYRFVWYSSNGSNCIIFAEVKFYENVAYVEEYVERGKAFHAQTLPMNTTSKILARVKDPREGLLGMANDPDNYGDLYVIGRDGKSHLTKSGTKSEIIFEGNANTVGNYLLTNSVLKYKFILIESRLNKDTSKNVVSQLISIERLLKQETDNAILFSTSTSSTDARYIGINFITGFDSFNVFAIKNTTTSSVSIERIIGIY